MSTPAPDIVAYTNLMKEIKLRVEVLIFFVSGKGHALYQPSTVETCYLQIRKILELIAFGSLAANKDMYSRAYANFASHWHAGRLLRDLEKVNPNFYPKPVLELPSSDPRARSQLKDRVGDFLTKAEFEQLYDNCGAIMHARNPYGQPLDYVECGSKLPYWQQRIMNLLNSHQVQLVGHPGFYLIHTKEDQDDEVHYYEFAPPPTGAAP